MKVKKAVCECTCSVIGTEVMTELFLYVAERAAKIVEQQERDRPPQKQASPRAGTPLGSLMGVVPSPSTMGMINHTMTPVLGNPSQRQQKYLTRWHQEMRLNCLNSF